MYIHIVVPFAYLLPSYSKFESGWECGGTGLLVMHTKKLSSKQNIQICCTIKWFLWKLDNLIHLYLLDSRLSNPIIMFSLLVYIEWFRGTSPNHGLRPLKAHNQTVTQAGNVTISWLHYLPKPSHHHQTLICRGSNDELMSANSQTVEDYHRLEIFCKF